MTAAHIFPYWYCPRLFPGILCVAAGCMLVSMPASVDLTRSHLRAYAAPNPGQPFGAENYPSSSKSIFLTELGNGNPQGLNGASNAETTIFHSSSTEPDRDNYSGIKNSYREQDISRMLRADISFKAGEDGQENIVAADSSDKNVNNDAITSSDETENSDSTDAAIDSGERERE